MWFHRILIWLIRVFDLPQFVHALRHASRRNSSPIEQTENSSLICSLTETNTIENASSKTLSAKTNLFLTIAWNLCNVFLGYSIRWKPSNSARRREKRGTFTIFTDVYRHWCYRQRANSQRVQAKSFRSRANELTSVAVRIKRARVVRVAFCACGNVDER